MGRVLSYFYSKARAMLVVIAVLSSNAHAVGLFKSCYYPACTQFIALAKEAKTVIKAQAANGISGVAAQKASVSGATGVNASGLTAGAGATQSQMAINASNIKAYTTNLQSKYETAKQAVLSSSQAEAASIGMANAQSKYNNDMWAMGETMKDVMAVASQETTSAAGVASSAGSSMATAAAMAAPSMIAGAAGSSGGNSGSSSGGSSGSSSGDSDSSDDDEEDNSSHVADNETNNTSNTTVASVENASGRENQNPSGLEDQYSEDNDGSGVVSFHQE